MKRFSVITALLGLVFLVTGFGGGPLPTQPADPEALFEQALHKEEGEGDRAGALADYHEILKEYNAWRPFASKAQLRIAGFLDRQRSYDQAMPAYQAVIDQFPDLPEAQTAAQRLVALGAQAPGELTPDDLVRRGLEKRIDSVQLSAAGLEKFVDYFRGISNINIVIGAEAAARIPSIGNAGGILSRPAGRPDLFPNPYNVTLNLELKDVSLANLLNLAAKSFGLDWTVWSGAVYIDTPGAIASLKQEAARKEIQPGSLDALTKELNDQKVSIAKMNLERAQKLVERGLASGTDVEEARLKLLEAQRDALLQARVAAGGAGGQANYALCVITYRDRGDSRQSAEEVVSFLKSNGFPDARTLVDNARQNLIVAVGSFETATTAEAKDARARISALSYNGTSFKDAYFTSLANYLDESGGGGGGGAAPPSAIGPGGTGHTILPNGREVTLYGLQLSGTVGPQFLDLDTGQTVARTGAFDLNKPDCFEGYAGYDLAVGRRTGVGVTSEGPTEPVRLTVLFVRPGAEVAFVPPLVELGQLIRPMSFPEPPSNRGFGTEDSPAMRREQSGQTAVLPADRWLVIKTDDGEYLVNIIEMTKDRVSLEYVKLPPAPEAAGASPPPGGSGRVTKVTLYDAHLEKVSAPKVLNLDTGEVIPDGPDGNRLRRADGSMREFFAAHPGFDLFYDDGLLGIVGEGNSAALLPEGTTAATVPASITTEYKSASSPSDIREPGVYSVSKQGMSLLVIEPGAHPVWISTKKGTYLITAVSKFEDSIIFDIETLK